MYKLYCAHHFSLSPNAFLCSNFSLHCIPPAAVVEESASRRRAGVPDKYVLQSLNDGKIHISHYRKVLRPDKELNRLVDNDVEKEELAIIMCLEMCLSKKAEMEIDT